jgi:hypothetical protein
MVSIDKYIDDIVTAVSINFASDIPINCFDIVRRVKRKIIADALLKNLFIKERTARALNMSRTTLVELLKTQYYLKLNDICKEHNNIRRRLKRNKYKKRGKNDDIQ